MENMAVVGIGIIVIMVVALIVLTVISLPDNNEVGGNTLIISEDQNTSNPTAPSFPEGGNGCSEEWGWGDC